VARQLICDFCKKPADIIAAKYYRAPILPGKSQVSFMSAYSHWADVCIDCDEKFQARMTKRKARNGPNSVMTTEISKKKAS